MKHDRGSWVFRPRLKTRDQVRASRFLRDYAARKHVFWPRGFGLQMQLPKAMVGPLQAQPYRPDHDQVDHLMPRERGKLLYRKSAGPRVDKGCTRGSSTSGRKKN